MRVLAHSETVSAKSGCRRSTVEGGPRAPSYSVIHLVTPTAKVPEKDGRGLAGVGDGANGARNGRHRILRGKASCLGPVLGAARVVR